MNHKPHTTTKPFSILIVCILISFGACKKYKEGPAFSLRTKKMRLTGDWVIQSINRDGKDVTSFYTNPKQEDHLVFARNGKYVRSGLASGQGSWEFSEHKEKLSITPDGYTTTVSYEIVRLTEHEFWINDAELVIKYKKKK